MKKAKILGLLMALTLTAVPATGIAENVLPVSNNAIVADAAYDYGFSLIMVDSGNYKRPELYSFDLNPRAKTVIMQNGDYSLIAEPSGKLYIYNNKTNKIKKTLNNTAYLGKKYPGTNKIISKLKIAFQTDGNIVVYAVFSKDDIRPLYHSYTYSSTLTVEKGNCNYYYFFEKDGTLRIVRIYKGGSSDEIFNSNRNNFFRLV